MSTLQSTISTNSISASINATTSSIGVVVSNTGGGTITYSWEKTGSNSTINTPSAPVTTVTGGGVTGITNLFCNITNSVTGVTYSSPVCIISWAGAAPGAPTIGASSSGDKSFTINWTAPVDDGGSPITGYYVQQFNTRDNVWSTPILVNDPLATSYNWSGNGVVYDGYTYKGRVAAVNDIDTGTYSGESTTRVPTFAAPTIQNVFGSAGFPSTASPGLRPFNVTFTPTSCLNYTKTSVYINYSGFDNTDSYFDTVNGGTSLDTITTGQQTTINITSCFAINFVQGSQYYQCFPSYQMNVYVRTYNNDNYYVDSAIWTAYTSAAYTFGPPPLYTISNNYSAVTGQFTVTGNTFTQTSVYVIPNADTNITGLTINAATNGTVTICTSSRYFFVDFANQSTTNFNQSRNCLTAPWSTNSGTTFRSAAFPNLVQSGFDQTGNGKIRVRGAGSIGTWATNQRILVTVSISGQTRTLTQY